MVGTSLFSRIDPPRKLGMVALSGLVGLAAAWAIAACSYWVTDTSTSDDLLSASAWVEFSSVVLMILGTILAMVKAAASPSPSSEGASENEQPIPPVDPWQGHSRPPSSDRVPGERPGSAAQAWRILEGSVLAGLGLTAIGLLMRAVSSPRPAVSVSGSLFHLSLRISSSFNDLTEAILLGLGVGAAALGLLAWAVSRSVMEARGEASPGHAARRFLFCAAAVVVAVGWGMLHADNPRLQELSTIRIPALSVFGPMLAGSLTSQLAPALIILGTGMAALATLSFVGLRREAPPMLDPLATASLLAGGVGLVVVGILAAIAPEAPVQGPRLDVSYAQAIMFTWNMILALTALVLAASFLKGPSWGRSTTVPAPATALEPSLTQTPTAQEWWLPRPMPPDVP